MDITRIDLLIANRHCQNVPLFQQAMERGRTRQLHFGLLSDGGVHSHIHICLRCWRWPATKSGEKCLRTVLWTGVTRRRTAVGITCASCSRKCANWLSARSATLVGRYLCDGPRHRWERVELAYRALVHGEAETRTDDPIAALQRSYGPA